MSHTVKIETKFSDWDLLKRAFKELGWEIKENIAARSYLSNDKRVYPYVAVNPGDGYDIGIEVDKTNIELYGDFFGGSVAKTLGSNLSELKKEYAYKTIEDEFLYQGYTVNKIKNTNGSWTVEVESQ